MKTAIITGASGNLGRAIVHSLLANNYYVIALVPPNDPNPLTLQHDSLEIREANLLNETDSGELVQSILQTRQHIDVAVLTVGGFAMGDIEHTSTSDIMRQVELNFNTTYNIARPVFLHMKKQLTGRIFFIGARPGLAASEGKGMISYSLGKSLVFRLADLMNEEAKGLRVATHIIVPSTIDTPQNRKAMPDARHSSWVKPEDIAEIIRFYSEEEAAAIKEGIIKIYGEA